MKRIKLDGLSCLLSLVLLFLSISNCIFTFRNANFDLLVVLLLPLLILVLTFFPYKYLLKKISSLSIKKEIIILESVVSLFVCGLMCFFKFNILNIGLMLNILFSVFSFLLTYIFVRKKFGMKNSIFSLLLYLLCFPVLLEGIINGVSFALFFIEILVFGVLSIDCSSLFRKRNIIKYSLIGISSFVLFALNPVLLIIIVPLMLFLAYKVRVLSLIKIMFIMLLFAFPTFLLELYFHFFEVFNIMDMDILNVSNIFILYDKVILNTIILFISLVFLLKKHDECNNKINFVFLLELLLIFICTLIDSTNLLFLVPILVSLFSMNVGKMNYYFPWFNVKVHKLPKEIKKVSVVIPNYNYACYIEKRIDSILKQNYPIYELIILDDMSHDNSNEVIERKIESIKITNPDLNIKYIRNQKNSGNVFKQWAKAFEVATGDYLWIAEADDLSSKYFLNVVMQGFSNDDIVMSYSESLAIDENGKIFKNDLRDWIDIYDTGRWDFDYTKSGGQELREAMCINNTIANVSSVVFKLLPNFDYRKLLKESQKFVLAGDWYFYSKVLLEGDIAYSKYSLNYHRIHLGSVTHTTDNFIHYNEVITIQDSINEDVKISKEIKKRVMDRRKQLQHNMCISNDELYYQNVSLVNMVNDKKINDEVLLSIIIPVYNTEKYLRKCFNSFIKTLPEKTEVIVINDGSLDNSEEIIMEYIEKYRCIRYIKKENGGLSSVKNLGLQEAKGRYVIFLDSDDYVSSDMYSTMLKKAIDKDADIVYCDVMMVFEDGRIRYCNMTNYNRNDSLMQIVDNGLMAASWNKMVRKNLYDGIEFPTQFNNEDIAVSPILLLNSNKTIKVESPFYKYLQRSGSIQNSGFSEKRFMVFDTSEILFKNISNYSLNQRKNIEGAVLTHQILAILIYVIAKINDKQERKKYIGLFCEHYNSLEKLKDNKYVEEFMKQHNVSSILDYIIDNDVEKIDKCLQSKFKCL